MTQKELLEDLHRVWGLYKMHQPAGLVLSHIAFFFGVCVERAKNEQQIVVAMIIIKISIIIILLEWWNNRIEAYQNFKI